MSRPGKRASAWTRKVPTVAGYYRVRGASRGFDQPPVEGGPNVIYRDPFGKWWSPGWECEIRDLDGVEYQRVPEAMP